MSLTLSAAFIFYFISFIFFFFLLVISLMFFFPLQTMEKKKEKEFEKEVWQGRTDGCFRVAPGLVFNFRWESPSLKWEGEEECQKHIFSRKWGQKAREWRGSSNKPDSVWEEVWKWRLGSCTPCSCNIVPPILICFMSVLSPVSFSGQISYFEAYGDNNVHLCHVKRSHFFPTTSKPKLVVNQNNSIKKKKNNV